MQSRYKYAHYICNIIVQTTKSKITLQRINPETLIKTSNIDDMAGLSTVRKGAQSHLLRKLHIR